MSDHYDRRSPVTGRVGNPMEEPRFLDHPSFMRAPLAATLDGLDIGIVGVPFDGGVTNRPGARFGPREIRNQSSQMRMVHHETRVNPYELCKVADVGDVWFEHLYDLEAAHGEIEDFVRRLCAGGIVPLTAGGDHSITYPILKAVAANGPVGLVQFDAHCDTWEDFKGSRSHHGAPFRRAVEENLIDPGRTVQIGIRGAQNETVSWDYAQEAGMRVLYMHEVARMGVDEVIAEARAIVGEGPVYVTFDIDSLDPAFAPGTGTPEIGGLTSLEAQTLVRGLRGLDLVGADVVEVSPPYDPSGNTALVGATMMYELLCHLAEALLERRNQAR